MRYNPYISAAAHACTGPDCEYCRRNAPGWIAARKRRKVTPKKRNTKKQSRKR